MADVTLAALKAISPEKMEEIIQGAREFAGIGTLDVPGIAAVLEDKEKDDSE